MIAMAGLTNRLGAVAISGSWSVGYEDAARVIMIDHFHSELDCWSSGYKYSQCLS